MPDRPRDRVSMRGSKIRAGGWVSARDVRSCFRPVQFFFDAVERVVTDQFLSAHGREAASLGVKRKAP